MYSSSLKGVPATGVGVNKVREDRSKEEDEVELEVASRGRFVGDGPSDIDGQ